MSNATAIANSIIYEMGSWSRHYYSDVVDYLAQQLNCSTSRISCREYNPIDNPSYDSGFVFLGPNNTKIAEIRWRKSGRCVGLYEYPDNIEEEKRRIDIQRVRRAREKSVQAAIDRGKRTNAIPYRKGTQEYAYAVRRRVTKAVATIASIIILGASAIGMHEMFNPSYVNSSYDAGYKAVSIETHRTYDNENYWYDYGDIAERYDTETMDFDSYVYGTYRNVGWDQQSRIDCMESLFRQFNLQGITHHSSFFDYCESKGAVVEKDGELVINTRIFSSVMEEYMTALNESQNLSNDAGISK